MTNSNGCWFENRSAPDGLHALVVGVSAYPHHPRSLPDLVGAAQSAAAFAMWLRDEYPPRAPVDAGLRSIRLLLSPVAVERDPIGQLPQFDLAQIDVADRASVLAALGAWANECRSSDRNVALLYLAGHGLQQSAENGLVLLADNGANAAQQWDEALDIGSVRAGLSKGPSRQWFFADACRVDVSEQEGRKRIEGHVGLDDEGGNGPEHAPVFFSSAPGTDSFFPSHGGLGLFTRALLECLRLDAIDRAEVGTPWMVTAEDLRKTVYKRTLELAATHIAVQKPNVGGTLGEAPLLVLRDDPIVPYSVHLNPKDAEPVARMRMVDGDRGVDIVPRCEFPVESVPTRAGTWNLEIEFDPAHGSYADKHTAVDVHPRRRVREVPVT